METGQEVTLRPALWRMPTTSPRGRKATLRCGTGPPMTSLINVFGRYIAANFFSAQIRRLQTTYMVIEAARIRTKSPEMRTWLDLERSSL
ncbi:hypothetical protein ElyMa_003028700 [Elysia marginata]|uniref:Uncharacterized protein n=1 Tax=Elysia marginata TaxID=1093978 RepID=A0AAV4IE29_9GAST|nr:hypothetical protein ElyMa_003028700 [Elysia marginata]